MKILFYIAIVGFIYNLFQFIILSLKKKKVMAEMQKSQKEMVEKWEKLKNSNNQL